MKLSAMNLNRTLFMGILLVNALTVLLVFHPSIGYWWQSHFSHRREQLTQLVEGQHQQPDIASPNRLVIPAMLLDEKIFTGDDSRALKKGVWLRPKTSTPGKGSNVVMAGHRTAYSRSPVFYHLDKLRRGDQLAVFWRGEKYLYKVHEIREVTPYQNEIERSSRDEQLTLYTCAPLGTSWRRLVVVAKEVVS